MSDTQDMPVGDNPAPSDSNTAGRPVVLREELDKFAALMDKRIEGIVAKVRELAPKKEPEQSKPDRAITEADLTRFRELGRIESGLTEEMRTELDALGSIEERLAVAKILAKAKLPANGSHASVAAQIPPGNASSAAPRTSPAHPRTVAEYKALIVAARKDPNARKRLDEIHDDPEFDNTALR